MHFFRDFNNGVIGIFLFIAGMTVSCKQTNPGSRHRPAARPADTKTITIGGLIGHAIDISEKGRLSQFITGPSSEAIQIFTNDHRGSDAAWKGEHAGKWLVAASKAAYRSHNERLKKNVLAVADFLIAQQLENGYLGTYADSMRFYHHTDLPLRT